MKDWTGNSKATFVTLGASNHSDKAREQNDFYATDFINGKYYTHTKYDGDSITSHISKDLSNLKEIITIIEKPKKIEKLNAKYTSQIGKLELANKIDEIIKKINEMEK